MDAHLVGKVSRYRDEIHGDIILDPVAVALINTAPLQRLGRIYQLGYAHLVYRGATHTRLSHVIGAYHMAGRFVDCLRDNYRLMTDLPIGAARPEQFLPTPAGASSASDDARWLVLRYLVQWAALLHDVGHIPLGHTLEDEFEGIYVSHDDFRSPRLPALWWREADPPSELCSVFGGAEAAGILPAEFHALGISAEVAYAAVMSICLYKEKREIGPHSDRYRSFESILKDALADEERPLDTAQKRFLQHVLKQLVTARGLFAPYMVDIVANTICADYMDYVRRDTANTGLDRQTDDRVLSQFLVGQYVTADGETQHRMALLLADSRGKPRLDACTGVVDLVRRRFRLAEIIYYHKTKVSASAMLAKALSLIGKPPEVPEGPTDLMRVSDAPKFAADVCAGNLSVPDLRKRQSARALLSPEIGDEALLIWLQEYAWSKAEQLGASRGRESSSDTARTLEELFRGIGLLQLLVRRQLFKVCVQIYAEGVAHVTGISGVDGGGNPEQIKRKIQEVLQLRGKANGQHERRAAIEGLMAKAAGWPEGSLLIYVPPRKSQAKGIETRALSSGAVVTLGEHPAVSGEVQSLSAQYERLWRVILLVHPDYQYDDLGLSRAVDAFLQAVWGVDLDKCQAHVRRLARFDYISEPQRSGASLFRELCATPMPRWRVYLDAPNALTPETTVSSNEQAYRAYMMTLGEDPFACGQRLTQRFTETSVEKRLAGQGLGPDSPVPAVRAALNALYEEVALRPEALSFRDALSEKSFDDQARGIFRQYLPASERNRLRPHHRDFIERNRKRSARERFLLIRRLRRYDLSDLKQAKSHFNREETGPTQEKLREIEAAVESETR